MGIVNIPQRFEFLWANFEPFSISSNAVFTHTSWFEMKLSSNLVTTLYAIIEKFLPARFLILHSLNGLIAKYLPSELSLIATQSWKHFND